MSTAFPLSINISDFDFSAKALPLIESNQWVRDQWPVIYFLHNQPAKIGYVGESVSMLDRINTHLEDPQRAVLKKISIIGSDKFNKSATLTIEAQLIQHIVAEGSFLLQNSNNGLRQHSFYQRSEYDKLFEKIWSRLQEKNIVQKNINDIRNSQFFKYSPYKSLNRDQHNSILEIVKVLNNQSKKHVFVKGCSGTGKTILATYLIKLLTTDYNQLNTESVDEDGQRELELMREFKSKFPNPTVGLVVAMQSLRKTLQKVFDQIPGLKASMVIKPSDAFKKKYDILIVDEAHRLRQRRNLSWMKDFSNNNAKLGLSNEGTELDWIKANSIYQIFFYDAAQSIKPSDVPAKHFVQLLENPLAIILQLKTQMRVRAGEDYMNYIHDLLNCKLEGQETFKIENYELKVFESFKELYNELEKKEQKFKQCRLVAGFAWPWFTKKNKSEDAYDIEIEGMRFWWNREPVDWVNSPTAFGEIGCIHTIQGYDLNYAGVIFGKEITYNPTLNRIEIIPANYYDRNGKAGIANLVELHDYIINIYKTLMYRGAYGTFVYACDDNLKKYLQNVIHPVQSKLGIRILSREKIRPYKNCVPLYNLKAAAGALSEPQDARQTDWVELPDRYTPSPDYFVCQVKGESMNRKIPNGAYCLFRKDLGGTREGKIVLVQHRDIQDADNDAGFTVKEYSSKKNLRGDRLFPEKITLKPLSNNAGFEDIVFTEDAVKELKVVGIFVTVL